MNVDLNYLGQSAITSKGEHQTLSLSPNLARGKVFFDAQLTEPLKFREAICALHEVVVGDHRFKPKDRTAYRAWLEEQQQLEQRLRTSTVKAAKAKFEAKKKQKPADLEASFKGLHRSYWHARAKWESDLRRRDTELLRHLVPLDPVVTVAPDAVLFECFSKDESSYGCLTVDRELFRAEAGAGLGTTNVDYSLTLRDHFQSLRTYRPTRFLVDPTGFEVQVFGNADYREEKIDLPPTWLRGFGQLQAAMALPSKHVTLAVADLYNVLAHLERHREKVGPRSIRFVLRLGRPVDLILEPWNVRIEGRGPAYAGDREEEVRIWGRRRLETLARVLPLTERIDVRLTGNGLPSIWTLKLPGMRFLLGLSGWTTNDWSGGASLEALRGDLEVDEAVMRRVEAYLATEHTANVAAIAKASVSSAKQAESTLHALAKRGQVLYDTTLDSYRHRSILPVALSEDVLGPEPEEIVEGRKLAKKGVVVDLEEITPGKRLAQALVGSVEVQAIVDTDGGLTRGKCSCSFFFKNALKKGPCRHLYAMRVALSKA